MGINSTTNLGTSLLAKGGKEADRPTTAAGVGSTFGGQSEAKTVADTAL